MRKTTLLIVDDEPSILSLTSVIFSGFGYAVIQAKDGEEALEKAILVEPDLIISDVVMPEKSGLVLTQEIRQQNTRIANVPIILLSAIGDFAMQVSDLDHDADLYLSKPFHITPLKEAVETLLIKSGVSLPHDQHESSLVFEDDLPLSLHKIKSSLACLDTQLKGGIPVGSNLLLIGPTGTGKSRFARHFIGEGLAAETPCLWVALDDNPQLVRYHLDAHLTQKNAPKRPALFSLVDSFAHGNLSTISKEPFSLQGRLDLNRLSELIQIAGDSIGQSVDEKSGGRRVIDSISSLIPRFSDKALQNFIVQLSRQSMALGGVTSIFILESTNPRDVEKVSYLFDGVIQFKKEGNTLFLEVASMKWTSYKKGWVAFQ